MASFIAGKIADSNVPGFINEAYNAVLDANFDVDVDVDHANELLTVNPTMFEPPTRSSKQIVRHPKNPEAQGGLQQQNDDTSSHEPIRTRVPDMASFEQELYDERKKLAAEEEEEDDLDISDFNALFNKCECERQQHRLAEKYFAWRQFYFMTLPLALVTMGAGIMAFLSTSPKIGRNEQILLATIVGCLSLLQVFWQTLGGKLKFDTKAEMHLSASIDLKRLADDLDFQKVEESQKAEWERDASKAQRKTKNEQKMERLQYAKRGLTWSPPVQPASVAPSESKKQTQGTSQTAQSNDAALEAGGTENTAGGKDINYYRAQYAQCMTGCKSTVPLVISQAFAVMDTFLALKLTKKSRRTLEHDLGKAGIGIMYAALCNYIYIEITDSRGWPYEVTKPEDVVLRAIADLEKDYNPKKNFFERQNTPVPGTRRWWCGTYSAETRTAETQTERSTTNILLQ